MKHKDKLLHFAFGLFASVGGFFFPFPGPAGLILAVLLGVAKEVWDAWTNFRAVRAGRPRPHSVDPLDAFATAAGGLPLFIWSFFA